MTKEEREEALRAYFDEGEEVAGIAQRLGCTRGEVAEALCDTEALEPYRRRSEAVRLRAQIRLNESAEQAARMQAALLSGREEGDGVTQRAAKDILDRAGVRVAKEDKKDVTIRFSGETPKIGMPRRQEEDAWTSC